MFLAQIKIKDYNHQLTFIDLCSGIGRFHFGLQNQKCVLLCNKFCRESHERNFNMKCKKDIFDTSINEFCDFDILCAGFPCQPFSSAGLKKGLNHNLALHENKLERRINFLHH